jgi:uncharacterized protein YndB with AHSA1/START domain
MTSEPFTLTTEQVVPGPPEAAFDAVTRRAAAYLWPVEYEPREGGAERGLTPGGGTVTTWEPPHRFATRAGSPGEEGYNQLTYTFAPHPDGTLMRAEHRTLLPADGYEVQADACRAHTAFYNHSLAEYVGHFAGRPATYVEAEGPERTADGGYARVRRALGVPDDAAVGDAVTLTGPTPIEGVVDHVSDTFLGVRSAEGLHRVYGRSRWGWPVSVAHHLFTPGADADALQAAWQAWIEEVA